MEAEDLYPLLLGIAQTLAVIAKMLAALVVISGSRLIVSIVRR